MHGWPHTFALQLDVADLLPDVDVVVMSLPGFAFSPPLDEPTTERRLAELGHALMTEVLGYSSYLTYGEDVTANVSDLIAATHPEAVAGIVVTHAHFLSQDEREATSDPARAGVLRPDVGGLVRAGGVRARPGHPTGHPCRRAERLAGRTARVAHREARRVERHPRGRPRSCGGAPLARPDPHRGRPCTG